jgi:YD repeat-containing protein
VTYTYTDRGTLYQKADGSMLETFTYDALGNLTRVERTGEADIDYVIDAQGRRVGKRVGGNLSKQYIWSGSLRIAAELENGAVVSRFIYGNSVTTPDVIVRKGTTDRLYRVIADHLGSPVYVVNLADPADVWLDASYDEWGNVTSFVLDGVDQAADTSAWPIPQGFAGGLFDADTGLVRFGVRDYDPKVGEPAPSCSWSGIWPNGSNEWLQGCRRIPGRRGEFHR